MGNGGGYMGKNSLTNMPKCGPVNVPETARSGTE
jgi:hypothetical protein